MTTNGYNTAKFLKKNILGRYARLFQKIDPKLAEHLLQSQKELFLAGQRFFEEEARHADKALGKIRRGQNDEPTTATAKANHP